MTTNHTRTGVATELLRVLSPVECLVEAISIGMLFTAILGCFAAAIL